MRARVKSTGDIISVMTNAHVFKDEASGGYYYGNELEFLLEGTNTPLNVNDSAWDNLRKQYAGMAMQALIGREASLYPENMICIAENAVSLADALIKELKK